MTEYGVMTIPASDVSGAVVKLMFNGDEYQTSETEDSTTTALAITKSVDVGDEIEVTAVS